MSGHTLDTQHHQILMMYHGLVAVLQTGPLPFQLFPASSPSAASSQLQHFSSSFPLSLLSFSASPFFSALSLTAFFSSLPQLLSFHFLSQIL